MGQNLQDLDDAPHAAGLVAANGGAEALPRILGICRQELGWDEVRCARERNAYLEYWRRSMRRRRSEGAPMSVRILSIDIGTQSARAIVFDAQGQLLAKAQETFNPTYVSPQPGWAEQDLELYWKAVVHCCQRLWSESDIRPQDITALTLTTQRATMICTDGQGRPLRPAIVWLDQRRCTTRRRGCRHSGARLFHWSAQHR